MTGPLSTSVEAVETVVLAATRPDGGAKHAASLVSEAARQGRLWAGLSAIGAVSPRTRAAAVDGMVAWAAGSAVAFGAKELVDRRRPRLRDAFGSAPTSSSMPSSHTASAVAYATAATLAVPATAPVVWPVAAAVAWSRAATGRHFPTDVAAGVGVGAIAGLVVHVVLSGRRSRSADAARAERIADSSPGAAPTPVHPVHVETGS